MTVTLRAASLLLWTAATLRAIGVRRTLARQLTVTRGVRVDEARAAAIAAAVHRIARFSRASCLARGIVIARLLSRESLEARLTIGVSQDPFEAHAWLEHGTLMVAGADPAREYVPLCRIEAGTQPAFIAAP